MFKFEITVGNLLSIISMICIALAGYYKFEGRTASTEKSVNEMGVILAHHEQIIHELVTGQTRLNTIIEERTKK